MVIITGASDGLGFALAKLLTKKGKKVVSLSRSKPLQDDIGWKKTDLMDTESISNAVTSLIDQHETIEALVNCAAVTSYEDIDALSPEELDRMFKTNVTAPMYLTSRLLDKLKQDGSYILNIGSTIVLRGGDKYQSGYATTKWALRGFTKNLAEELKPTNCRVASVLVGGFNSKLHEKVTGNGITDPENWMNADDIAKCISHILELPKNMEISEIVINRKTHR